MGQLLVKLAASEFVAYIELANLKDSSVVHLTYQKSVIMATIMLCGFANFASIGIQVAGLGILAPKNINFTELGVKSNDCWNSGIAFICNDGWNDFRLNYLTVDILLQNFISK